MTVDSSPGTLKNRLPHTWPLFFARHGNFTDIQLQAIPPILGGENTLVMAATAAGKTEAVIAPLLERHLLPAASPIKGASAGFSTDSSIGSSSIETYLRILYLSPTRALVRDLYERLRIPLEASAISLAMKSGDTGPLTRLPRVLITTPESTDSLLTRSARSFVQLQAVVIDEVHLFDGGPRGDHVRCLLNRIGTIRSYYYRQTLKTDPPPLQRVALSATVSDPVGVASRYLRADEREPVIVEVGGGRSLDAEIFPALELEDVAKALLWRAWGDPPARKSLLFCNTRREVEQTAAYLRSNLGYEASVFVHYSNLDPAMRRTVEEDFTQAGTAVCVCTSTLELGIDIGSIDDVVLAGPPPSLGSFLQRIGRGNRRSNVSRVLCLARDPLEQIQFQALVELAGGSLPTDSKTAEGGVGEADTGEMDPAEMAPIVGSSDPNAKTDFQPATLFRPSILIQQVFSLLKQSPTGSVRLADVRRVSPVDLGDDDLYKILDELVQQDFLRRGRPNEWRPGAELDLLLDAHEIYSNIGSDPLSVLVVDDYSGRTLARMERSQVRGPTLQLGGRTWAVAWRDRYRIGLRVGGKGVPDESFRPGATPMTVSLAMGQAVACHFGIASPTLPVIQDLQGTWVCHFWGDLYGRWLAAMLQGEHAYSAAHVDVVNEHVLYVHGRVRRLPPWDEAVALRHLRGLAPDAIPYLNLGRFHSLLPPMLAWQTVLSACELSRFEQIYRQAELVHISDGLAGRLRALL